MDFKPHDYQKRAIDHILRNDFCALFLDMGLGKTVCALTAIDILMNQYLDISSVLVVAPKKVAESQWSSEVSKWDHLSHLRTSVVLGTEKQRLAALSADADVYVTSRDNVVWLLSQGRRYDCIVIDEMSSFKNYSSKRFKAMRRLRTMAYRLIGLTGTPAPNGLLDLFPQIFLLDQGERLGKTITAYRRKYFTPGRGNGNIVYEYIPRPEAHKEITSKISDICISMSADDYLTLPVRLDQVYRVKFSEADRKAYKKFEKELVMNIDDTDIAAISAAALSNKLRQYANGAMYDDDHNVHEVSSAKIEALSEIIESVGGQSVLIFYQFKHDVPRIIRALTGHHVEVFDAHSADLLKRWNAREVEILLAHPASTAYGLNMQSGGHICIWFGVDWNLELYQQANARLHRQGQQHPVTIIHLIVDGTIEDKVISALQGKADMQTSLLNAVKSIKSQYERD